MAMLVQLGGELEIRENALVFMALPPCLFNYDNQLAQSHTLFPGKIRIVGR